MPSSNSEFSDPSQFHIRIWRQGEGHLWPTARLFLFLPHVHSSIWRILIIHRRTSRLIHMSPQAALLKKSALDQLQGPGMLTPAVYAPEVRWVSDAVKPQQGGPSCLVRKFLELGQTVGGGADSLCGPLPQLLGLLLWVGGGSKG